MMLNKAASSATEWTLFSWLAAMCTAAGAVCAADTKKRPDPPSEVAVQAAVDRVLPELAYRSDIWGPAKVAKPTWHHVVQESGGGDLNVWRVIAVFAYKNRRPIREAHDLMVKGDQVSAAKRSSEKVLEQAFDRSSVKQKAAAIEDRKKATAAVRTVSDKLVSDPAFREKNAQRRMDELVREELFNQRAGVKRTQD